MAPPRRRKRLRQFDRRDIVERFCDLIGRWSGQVLISATVDDDLIGRHATLGELHRIFDETGGTAFFENIERCSERKARELGYDGADERYFMDVYTRNSQNEDE